MLLIHLILSIFPETRCLKIHQTARRNMLERLHVWPINISWSVTAMEGSLEGNRGKQPQSDAMEESRVPEVCLLQCLHGNSRWTIRAFALIFRKL